MLEIERIDVRCPNCNRLLFKTVSVYGAQIKCPRCKVLVPCSVQSLPPVETLTDVPPTDALSDAPTDLEVLKE